MSGAAVVGGAHATGQELYEKRRIRIRSGTRADSLVNAEGMSKALTDWMMRKRSGDHQRAEMIRGWGWRHAARNGSRHSSRGARRMRRCGRPLDRVSRADERIYGPHKARIGYTTKGPGEVALVYRADPRERRDDVTRKGHPLRL